MAFEWASASVAIGKINFHTSMYLEIFDAQVLDKYWMTKALKIVCIQADKSARQITYKNLRNSA